MDYIKILLEALEEQISPSLGESYYQALSQENAASQTLRETLSEAQHKLFLAYEEHGNARSSIYQEILSHQAFLLAREIYR